MTNSKDVTTVNDYLEQQTKCLYSYMFLQKDLESVFLDQIAEMYQPHTISSNDLIADGKYFVYGANGIIGKYDNYNHEEHQIAIACRGASCGNTTMTNPFAWITGNAMVVKPKDTFPYKEYLYYSFKAKSPSYLMTGSAQPQITRENLQLYTIKLPSHNDVNKFEKFASNSRKMMLSNNNEINHLTSIRDWLLPILMNGQATIGD